MPEQEAIDARQMVPAPLMELSTDDILRRLTKIEEVQRKAMKQGIDFGVIPGTGSKPTLLKAGAEKLCVLFRLDAQCQTERVFDGPHLTATTVCTIYHQVSGERLGSATAMCSSKESKYAWRKASRVCPECGKEAIIKGRAEYGGGWVCFKKKDGCGAKFPDLDPAIVDQLQGRVPNDDIADQFPTVLRIAEKRALVAAVRLVTGASAIFDEDMPDHDEDTAGSAPDAPQPAARQKPTDTITPEQWNGFSAVVTRHLGVSAKAWINDHLKAGGYARAREVTVGALQAWTQELTEAYRGEEPQDGIDPADTFPD